MINHVTDGVIYDVCMTSLPANPGGCVKTIRTLLMDVTLKVQNC